MKFILVITSLFLTLPLWSQTTAVELASQLEGRSFPVMKIKIQGLDTKQLNLGSQDLIERAAVSLNTSSLYLWVKIHNRTQLIQQIEVNAGSLARLTELLSGLVQGNKTMLNCKADGSVMLSDNSMISVKCLMSEEASSNPTIQLNESKLDEKSFIGKNISSLSINQNGAEVELSGQIMMLKRNKSRDSIYVHLNQTNRKKLVLEIFGESDESFTQVLSALVETDSNYSAYCVYTHSQVNDIDIISCRDLVIQKFIPYAQ